MALMSMSHIRFTSMIEIGVEFLSSLFLLLKASSISSLTFRFSIVSAFLADLEA